MKNNYSYKSIEVILLVSVTSNKTEDIFKNIYIAL